MYRRLLVVSWLGTALLACAWAQGPADDDYKLHADDVVAITVWDAPEFTVPEVMIRPDGKIVHPFVGEIVAAGKTSAQLAEDIRQALLKELRDPRVTVIVLRFRENWLFVVGAVGRPGPIAVRGEPMTLQQAIIAAGGPTEEADQTCILVVAPDGARREVDVIAEPEAGDMLMTPGATIQVPERPPQSVAVTGAVRSPGIFEILPGDRISEALARAGGPTEDAAPRAGRLARSGEDSISVNLAAILENANDPANVTLQHGDAILVPTCDPIAVLGAVQAPGIKTLEAGKRVSDAIGAAGGFTREADAAHVTLLRADAPALTLDLCELQYGRRPKDDIELAGGGTVFVPGLPEVVVLGAVSIPGPHPVKAGSRFWDALVVAGGLLDYADRATAAITHRNGETSEVDLAGILADRRCEANVLLAEGDTIVIKSLAEGQVTVLGAVSREGRYTLAEVARIADLVAVAGRTEDADVRATLHRADGTRVEVDLEAVDEGGPANLKLADGDTLLVRSAVSRVTVLGAVSNPGHHDLRRGERVSHALAAAGGLADGADRNTATVMRADSTFLEVDLDGALRRRDVAANIRLEPGDTLLVAAAISGNAAIMGAVAKPALVPIERGQRISDVLAQAGGLSDEADRAHAMLTRADGTRVPVDLTEILGNEETGANIEIANGDTLYVPSLNVGQVAVVGAVTMPGRYAIGRDERVSGAIALAGGITTGIIVEQGALLQANGTRVQVNVKQALSEPGSGADALVGDGDTLVIHEVEPVTVLGAVASPGVVPLGSGAKVSTAVAYCRGARPDSDLRNATLTHKDGAITPVDLQKALNEGDSAADVPVRPGDILYIPFSDWRVSVIGAVRRQGDYDIRPGSRLTYAIVRAQGLKESADTEQCTIIRDGKALPVDLGAVMRDKNAAANVELQDGDLIIFDELLPLSIAVLGEVESEGNYELVPGSRLSHAVAKAGGPSESADPERVRIIRGDGKQIVNLRQLLEEEGGVEDPVLENGDVVVVPLSSHMVTVLGNVHSPGAYYFRPGDRLLDAVNHAGGWVMGQGAPNRTILTREVEDGRAWKTVNLLLASTRADMSQNPELGDGDLLYIPSISQKGGLDAIVKMILPATNLLRLMD